MITNMIKTIIAMLVSATRDKLRKRMMAKIKVGKIYLIDHKAMGNFRLKVTKIQGEWVDGIMVDIESNILEGGEVTMLMRNCSLFTELKKEE